MNKKIEETFVHYKTKDAFERDLAEYGIDAFEKKIVFIKNEHAIWTHGVYYNCDPNKGTVTVYIEGETLCFTYNESAA